MDHSYQDTMAWHPGRGMLEQLPHVGPAVGDCNVPLPWRLPLRGWLRIPNVRDAVHRQVVFDGGGLEKHFRDFQGWLFPSSSA